MQWAPDTMRSHLKEYINNKGEEGTSTHAGLYLWISVADPDPQNMVNADPAPDP